jgi:Tol biopolymer transport system component
MVVEFGGPPTSCGPDQGPNCNAIVLMDGDGSNQRMVYASDRMGSHLDLSPDGSQIAISLSNDATRPVTGGQSIFTIDADGTRLRRLTRQRKAVNATDTWASWSPTGTTVAFESDRDQAITGHSWSLFSVSVRNRKISRVIPGSATNDLYPDWAPDGDRLAFTRTFGYPDYRLYTVRIDGTDEREILRDFSAPHTPLWSPDGTQIAYWRQGIWLVGSDGSNPHPLVAGGSWGMDWMPAT